MMIFVISSGTLISLFVVLRIMTKVMEVMSMMIAIKILMTIAPIASYNDYKKKEKRKSNNDTGNNDNGKKLREKAVIIIILVIIMMVVVEVVVITVITIITSSSYNIIILSPMISLPSYLGS